MSICTTYRSFHGRTNLETYRLAKENAYLNFMNAKGLPVNDNTKTTASRLASVFADVFGLPLDRVHPDLDPDDVERWDSLGHVMLITAIEVEFSIQFEVNQIMEFTSFQAIIPIIDEAVRKGVQT